jgi:hypothetical protein
VIGFALFATGCTATPGREAASPKAGAETWSCEDCVILPLGDSITDGYGVPGGYRVELFRRARAAKRSITFIGSKDNGPDTVEGVPFPQNHEGHSGIMIEPLGAEFVPGPGVEGVPDIVLLMIGTNDIADQVDVVGAPARLGVLLDDIHDTYPEALLVVAQITPIAPPFDARLVQDYNGARPPLVQQRATAGKPIMLVDMYNGFPMQTLEDGIHPNAAGYAYMAGVWYAAIGNLLR